MASTHTFNEEDLACPVCRDIFKDPVIMACSHSMCRACLKQFWDTRGCRECPLCRQHCAGSPPPNRALKNLCETFSQGKRISSSTSSSSNELCNLHSEKFKLFCLEDKELLCVVCRDSNKHTNHTFRPVLEVAESGKKELRVQLGVLKEKMKIYEEFKTISSKTASYAKKQAQDTERLIRKEFEQLHQFLRDEEAARICALREEVAKIEKMDRDIACLSDTIQALEKDMKSDTLAFLKNVRSIEERAWCPLQDPEKIPLIDVAKHLGNLKFNVWRKMQKIVQFTPVTLDPNTAHKYLAVSDDLTSVGENSEWSEIPDNPERFDDERCVLGSEGFNSGIHCWDVEVGENTWWRVGVMTESNRRKGEDRHKSGLWHLERFSNTYEIWSPTQQSTYLQVTKDPEKIRVALHWDRGEISFTDPDSNTLIHTCTDTFTERMFPYFYNLHYEGPLRVLPATISVIMEHATHLELMVTE